MGLNAHIYTVFMFVNSLLRSFLKFDFQEELSDQKEEEKRKRREEKARLARQAAIEELQKKRDEKRHENQRKAEEELVSAVEDFDLTFVLILLSLLEALT